MSVVVHKGWVWHVRRLLRVDRGWMRRWRAIELNHELRFEVHIPRHDDFDLLAEWGQRVWPNEEVVGQVDFRGRTQLLDDERSVLSPHIDVSESKTNDDCSRRRWQPRHDILQYLLPAVLSFEFDLGEGRESDVQADQLGALVSFKAVALRALRFQLELLADLDKFCLHVLEFHGHGLYAVVFNVCLFDHAALIAADHFELAGLVVLRVVFLEHLGFAAEVCALDGQVLALISVLLQVRIRHSLSAAFLSVLALGLELGELPGQKRVWVDELHVRRAARRADHLEVALHQLVNIVVHTLLAEAFAAFAALARVEHDVPAQEAVEEWVMLLSLIDFDAGVCCNLDLVLRQGHSSAHD